MQDVQMPTFLRSLLLFLADGQPREALDLDRALAPTLLRIIEFLKAQLEIALAHSPQRLRLTAAEKARLVALSRELGPELRGATLIVNYRTLQRWSRPQPEAKTAAN